MDRDECDRHRWDGGDGGHYESWFQRANHPTRPLAFWLRYTIFAPRGRARDAVGELWACYFDGEADTVTAVKQVVPLARCRFAPRGLDVSVGDATLDATSLRGTATLAGHTLRWELAYRSSEPPLLLLPRGLYGRALPRAKLLVASPLATFRGVLSVDGAEVPIDGWRGSHNHNWGSRHTDEYAWGQVMGFDDAPESYLEVASARLRVGPLRTPWMTLAVLHHEGARYAWNSPLAIARARQRRAGLAWDFATPTLRGASLRGRLEAPRERFVGLTYDNPPGGQKLCLNSKLARCELTLLREGRAPLTLRTRDRAALELLSDREALGIPVLAV